MTEIPCFKAEKFTITISTRLGRYKVLKLIFHKRDGSIFLSFPYFRNSKGIVSIGTIPRGVSKVDVNLQNKGKVTSHLVKYSHHPDGTVLFSQDRRIFSKIKKKSKPLHNNPGHIFTIQLQDLYGFEILEQYPNNDNQTDREHILNFHFNNGEPEAIKLLGYWHTKQYVLSEQNGQITKPGAPIIDKSGKVRMGFLISPLDNNPSSHSLLMLMIEAIPRLIREAGSHITFIGGFDPIDVVNDLSSDASFLAFKYPADNFEKVKNAIGSIDILEETL